MQKHRYTATTLLPTAILLLYLSVISTWALLLPVLYRFAQGKCSIRILKLSLEIAIIGWPNYHNLCSWFSLAIMWTRRSLYSGSVVPLSPVWEFLCYSRQKQCIDFQVSSEETSTFTWEAREEDDGTVTVLRYFQVNFLSFSSLHPFTSPL